MRAILALFWLIIGVGLGTSGCGPSSPCSMGEQFDDELGRCIPAVAHTCPPGTMARLGESGCVRVGPSRCPDGFRRASDGWGCRAVFPAEGCEGAAVARLGHADCVPMGDCDAPFPPPGTTHLVTQSGGGGNGVPIYTDLLDALDVAPEGSIIAVDEGIWDARLYVDRSITLVGRCAARTVITSRYYMALEIMAVTDGAHATLRGITLKAAWHGPIVIEKAHLTLIDSLIEDVYTYGLLVSGQGSGATLRNTTIRGVSRMEADDGFAVLIGHGASLRMSRSELTGAHNVALAVGLGGRAVVDDSLIHSHRGRGIEVIEDGEVIISRSAIVDNERGGATVAERGARLAIVDSVIEGNRGGPGGDYGVSSREDASLLMLGTTVRANENVGVYVSGRAEIGSSVVIDTRVLGEQTGRGLNIAEGGVASIRDSAVVGNRFIGIALSSLGVSVLNISRSVVTGTLPGVDGSFGYGIIGDADMTIEGVTIEDNRGVGLYSMGGHVRADRLLVRGHEAAVGAPGIGVIAAGGARVDLEHSRLAANADLGIGFEVGTSGSLRSSFVENHPFGIHPAEGVSLIESAQPRDPGRSEVILDRETVFRGNRVDQAGGMLILPDLPFDL